MNHQYIKWLLCAFLHLNIITFWGKCKKQNIYNNKLMEKKHNNNYLR